MYAARIDQALQRKYVEEMEVLLAEGISCPVDDLTLLPTGSERMT